MTMMTRIQALGEKTKKTKTHLETVIGKKHFLVCIVSREYIVNHDVSAQMVRSSSHQLIITQN